MLFKAPGKSNNYEYQTNQPYQNAFQLNQRSVITFNNSFTLGQKCSSQQKLTRNGDQRYFNFQSPTFPMKTQPSTIFEDDKYKQQMCFKSNTFTDLSRGAMPRQNNINAALEQECLILRKQKSQFSQKMKKAEEELQTKDNFIRGKQRQIQQLKLMHTQSLGSKPLGDPFAQLKSQKQKLYFQLVQTQSEFHKLQQKYEKMQRQHYGLSQKYDELSNKSTFQMSRKAKREQMLQSQLSLSQNRNQRIKNQYQKQLSSLKQKIRQLQNENSRVTNNKSSVVSFNASSFMDNLSAIKSQPDLQNSRIEIQKLNGEIKQKNQMIRFLEIQCLKQKKKQFDKSSEFQSKSTIPNEQGKRQIARLLKQVDYLRKQNSSLYNKVLNGQKMREQLIKQVKELEYLLKQVRDKLFKSMQQNKNINQVDRENCEKAQKRVAQLQTQIKRLNMKIRQEDQSPLRQEKAISELKQKYSNELMARDAQIRQYSIQKQQLMEKITQYQRLLKQNEEMLIKYEDTKLKLRQISEQRKINQERISIDVNNNIQNLQKQLKFKVDELFKTESVKISLQKEYISVKKALEQRITDLTIQVARLEDEKKKSQKQKRAAQIQIQKLKLSHEQKILQLKTQNKQKHLQQLQEVKASALRTQQRHTNIINSLRQQQRKLMNMIAELEKTNLNLTIQVQNQKMKLKTLEDKYRKLKEDKRSFKSENQTYRAKSGELEKSLQVLSTKNNSYEMEKLDLRLKIDQKTKQLQRKEQTIFNLQSQLAEQLTRNQGLSKSNKLLQQQKAKCDTEIKGLIQKSQKDSQNEQFIQNLQAQLKQRQLVDENREKQIARQQQTINNNTIALKEQREKVQRLQKQVRQKGQLLNSVKNQIKTLNQNLNKEKGQFNNNINRLQTELAIQKKKIDALIKQREKSVEDTIRIENQLTNLKEQLSAYKNETGSKQQKMTSTLNQLNMLKVANQKLMAQLQQKGQNISKMELQIVQRNLNIQQLLQQRSLKEQEIKRLQNLLKESNVQHQQIVKQKIIKEELIFMLQSSIAQRCSTIQAQEKENMINVEKLGQMNRIVRVKETEINEMQQRIKRMQADLQIKTQQSTMNESSIQQQYNQKLQQKQLQLAEKVKCLKQKQISIIELEGQTKKMRIRVKQLQKLLQETATQCQFKIQSYTKSMNEQTEQIKLLQQVVKQRQLIQNQQRLSLDEKEKYSKQIELQLEELTIQLKQIKAKFEEVESRKISSASEIQEEQKYVVPASLKLSKMSAKSSQSFIADYIQIDKNALLYICDLLGIQPTQGQILKSIIEYLESGNFHSIQQHYREILQLFGVEVQITQKTQAILINQIKSFRQTISNLIQKASLLQKRCEGLHKQNHRLVKQNNKMQDKNNKILEYEYLIQDLGCQIMREKFAKLNDTWRGKLLEAGSIQQ